MQVSKTYVEKAEEGATQGRWILEGYASTDDLDAQGHVVSEEAIKMGANSLLTYNTVLYNHDSNRPIGVVEKAEAHGAVLFIKVVISKSEPSIWEKVKDGTLSKFSIRGRVTAAEPQILEGSDQEVLVIKGMELFEVSVVSVPANVKARALSWYVEKSFKELGQEKALSILRGGEPIVKTKIEEALSALEKASDEVSSQEDKDQIASTVRGLKALQERLAGGKSIEEVKPVVEEVKPVVEATPAASEVKVEGLSEIVSQLQSLAKQVVDGTEKNAELVKQLEAQKAEVAKMVEQVITIADKFSVRKGAGPGESEENRSPEVIQDPVEIVKKSPGFDKMKPGDKLQKILEAKIAGKVDRIG